MNLLAKETMDQLGKNSRKEKRKEARSANKNKKFQSWTQHQNTSMKKEASSNSEPPPRELIEKQTVNMYSSSDLIPSTQLVKKEKKKSLKRKLKKNKFQEFLEMDMNKENMHAKEDLEMERKLAKKLKVKGGKLRGFDDGINILFEGVPSVLDSTLSDKKMDDGEEAIEESHDSLSLCKKRHRRKSSGTTVKQSEDEEHIAEQSEVSFEEPQAKTPVENETVKYLAPHLRSRNGNESEELSQIRRRVRGLLNRLSESNVEPVTEEIAIIFRSIGRIIGCEIIGDEVLSSCCGGPRGNEQYAAVFSAFVGGMACLVGIDFSAKLIASLAKSFEDKYLKEDSLSLRNLTLLLSYLCIFGICSSDLIYDLLFVLSKRLTEMDVATILTILQCCGMKLRGDDPSAMKDFILHIQNRVNEFKSILGTMQDEQPQINNKRMEFMLETICDIKNNKKRSKEDPVYHTRLKKWLQKLRAEDVLLRGLKWSKLLDPDKKGQWWLSGETASTLENVEEVASTIDREVPEAQKLMQLATAQRMNTDIRRAIFCIIISGEDYIDAFEKILRLDLSGKQDREIMRVLVDCCLQEKVFNKYYTVLASKLCSHAKNHKFTLQYCLWDHFKELESMELIRSINLARFTAEMLSSFTLSLAMLKSVDLADPKQLTPRRVMHFRLLFEAVFEHTDAVVWNIFTRVAAIPELDTLRNSLEFFMKQYVVPERSKSITGKFKIAKKALNNVAGILM